MPETTTVPCENAACDAHTQMAPRFAKGTAAWYCSDTCRDKHEATP